MRHNSQHDVLAGAVPGRHRGRVRAGWVIAILALLLAAVGLVIVWNSFSGEPQPSQPTGAGMSRPVSPLVLELPQPRYVGTPINLRSPNLEKPRGGPRPEFRIPAGTKNVALHKPVTASDNSPLLGELKQVTDGDKEGIEGSYVEIGPGKQYFQVDLQQAHAIHAIVVWHYHAQARIYHDVIVQVSGDSDFSKDVRTLYNNDHDNSLGLGAGKDKEYIDSHEGLLIDAAGATARYVRLWGSGNTESDLNHCTEIEVYGGPLSAP